MSTTQESNANVIIAVFRFIHNIPSGIIDQVWNPDTYGWMNTHFKTKYEGFCKKEGYASPNAILQFAATLDEENLKLFSEKIDQIIKTSNF
ncbi:MAG: hypothetical protein Q8R90_07380 [Bacteroidales bacterium]|nr:hypothetical protein [Bacteroidales bacterium]MDP3452761.1 hypothetical protein [Bacteroidales bacterium]